jgi:hypothetical protein
MICAPRGRDAEAQSSSGQYAGSGVPVIALAVAVGLDQAGDIYQCVHQSVTWPVRHGGPWRQGGWG